MKRFFLLLSSAALLLASCEKDKEDKKDGVFKGPEVTVHGGKAWTWIQLNQQGTPERVAIAIKESTFASLPIGNETGGGHSHENNFILKFHPKADATPFEHVYLNWNPNGHPPAGVYNVPHFDLHYYTVSSEEREAMVDPAKLDADPAPGYIPANHLGVDPVPQMGKHFVDLTSPELSGAPFTQTFIFGSHDTKVVFWEPMITLDFLKNTNSFVRDLPQPAKFQKAGYYPTKMRVEKANGVTNVILEGFVLRQAS